MCIMNYLNPILIFITVGIFATFRELLIILMMRLIFLKKVYCGIARMDLMPNWILLWCVTNFSLWDSSDFEFAWLGWVSWVNVHVDLWINDQSFVFLAISLLGSLCQKKILLLNYLLVVCWSIWGSISLLLVNWWPCSEKYSFYYLYYIYHC